MAKKSKAKTKTKKSTAKAKKQKFGYVRPEWSTAYKKSQASKKVWEKRKANPEYSTEEQKQARREISRKAYATRAGIQYVPEVIPKYGIPSFIKEQGFSEGYSIVQARELRREYEQDLKKKRPYTTRSEVEQERGTYFKFKWLNENTFRDSIYLSNTDYAEIEMKINEERFQELLSKSWLNANAKENLEKQIRQDYINLAASSADDDFTIDNPFAMFAKEEIENAQRVREAEQIYRSQEVALHSVIQSGSIKDINELLEFVSRYASDISESDAVLYFINNSPRLTEEQRQKIYNRYFVKPKEKEEPEKTDEELRKEHYGDVFYDSNEDFDGDDWYKDYDDITIENFEDIIDQFDLGDEGSDWLQNRQEGYKNAIKEIVNNAVNRDGKSAVAQRLDDYSDEIAEITNDMLKYKDGEGILTNQEMNIKLTQLANIINGSTLDNEESEGIEDTLRRFNY